MKVCRIIAPPVTQLLRSKWLNFFSRCTERKIESFWPKKFGQIFVPPVTQLFISKWLIFSLGALSEKLSHFDLNSWVKFLFRKWLNFLSQNDSFFLSVHWVKKIEPFWPKKLGQILVPPIYFQILAKFRLKLTQGVTGSLVYYKSSHDIVNVLFFFLVLMSQKCKIKQCYKRNLLISTLKKDNIFPYNFCREFFSKERIKRFTDKNATENFIEKNY